MCPNRCNSTPTGGSSNSQPEAGGSDGGLLAGGVGAQGRHPGKRSSGGVERGAVVGHGQGLEGLDVTELEVARREMTRQVAGPVEPPPGPLPLFLSRGIAMLGRDAGAFGVPLLEPSPAGHARTAAQLFGEQFPRDAASEYKEDAGQHLPVGQPRSTPARPSRLGWQ